MSPAPSPFTFDLDLGSRQRRGGPVPDAALEAMLMDARSEGVAEGLAEAQRTATGRLAAAADSLAGSAAMMAHALEDAQRAALAEAVDLSAAIARKLSQSLIAGQPIAELDALIAECLGTIETTPHLVVRCHPELADAIRLATEARIAATGFAGRLIVIGDPEVALGDGRIEWADGGLVRDSAAITAAIDVSIANYLEARGIARPKETDK